MLGLAYSAEVFGELTLHSLLAQIWAVPFLVWFVVADVASANKWVVWAVITLLLSYPSGECIAWNMISPPSSDMGSAHPIQVGWNSRNSNTVRSRTVSAACYNMFVQASGIISSNIYRKDDAPNYKRGNRNLLGIAIGNICLYILTKVYYTWRNTSKEKKWSAMTSKQQLEYLETTTDEGNKRVSNSNAIVLYIR